MRLWLRILLAGLVGLGLAAAGWEIGMRLMRPWEAAACEKSGGRLHRLPSEPFHEGIFICEFF